MVLLLFHYQNLHFRVLLSDLSFELTQICHKSTLYFAQTIQSLDLSLLICKMEKNGLHEEKRR